MSEKHKKTSDSAQPGRIVPHLGEYEQKYLTYYNVNERPSRYLPPPKKFVPSFKSMLYAPIRESPGSYMVTKQVFEKYYGADLIQYTADQLGQRLKEQVGKIHPVEQKAARRAISPTQFKAQHIRQASQLGGRK